MSANNNNTNQGSSVQAIVGMLNVNNEVRKDSLEAKALENKVFIEDAYSNSLLGIGKKDVVESFTKYGFENDTLNWTLWMTLYNDSWVFKRAIDMPAQDIVGHGITLQGDSDKTQIYKRLNTLNFELTQTVMWGRLFGGSIAVMLFDKVKLDQMYQSMDVYFKNGNINASSTLKLYSTDRWYGVAPSDKTITRLSSDDFGKPVSYRVTFTDGKTYQIHHSWILRYEGRTAPKLVKQGMLQGWGYAEGAHILNELSRDDKLKSSIHSLIDKSLIEVIKMSGMRGVFMGADQDNENQLRKRLEMVNWGRNFNSLTFLDQEDEYIQNQFGGLGGLADLLEKNMWLVSSALEMQGILFGDLKGGFSNDNEALTRYNGVIQNLKNSYYRPVLTKLLKVLYKMHNINEEVVYEFNSLITREDKDKFDDIDKLSRTLNSGIADGYITPVLAAKTFKKYAEKIGLDIDMDEAYFDEIAKLTNESNEDFDIGEDGEEITTIELNDGFTIDITHVKWIEMKYKSNYPSLRVGWYEVDPRKQAKSSITLTPSLYIFHDNHAPGRNADSANTQIRFSDHNTRFSFVKDFRFKNYDRAKYEAEADKFIAKNHKLMEKLYDN